MKLVYLFRALLWLPLVQTAPFFLSLSLFQESAETLFKERENKAAKKITRRQDLIKKMTRYRLKKKRKRKVEA